MPRAVSRSLRVPGSGRLVSSLHRRAMQGGIKTPTPPAHLREVAIAPPHPVPTKERRKEPPPAPAASGAPTARLSASPRPQPQPHGRFYSSRYQMSIIGSEKQQTL